MEINLDEKVIAESINRSATEAIKNATSSWNVKNAIEERVANAVLEGVMGDALISAMDAIDVAALSTALANQLQRSVVAGAVAIVQDSVVEQIMRLRKVPEYDDAKRAAARAEIEARLFGRMA